MIWPSTTRPGPAALTGRQPGTAPGGRARPPSSGHRRADVSTRPGHQPCNGGGVQSFHLEPVAAGGDCAVLRLEGEIDASAAPHLGDMVAKLAENGAVTSSPTCARPA